MQPITRSSSGDRPTTRRSRGPTSGLVAQRHDATCDGGATKADNRGTPFGPTPLRKTGVPSDVHSAPRRCPLPPGAPRVRADRSRRRRCRRAFMTTVSVSPLTPLSFLQRAAEVFPDKPAIVYGDRSIDLSRVRGRGDPAGPGVAGLGRSTRVTGWPTCAPTSPRCWSRTSRCRWPGRCSSRSTPGCPRRRSATSSTTPARSCWWSTPSSCPGCRRSSPSCATVREVVR